MYKRGFSLIEVLIVIVLISILGSAGYLLWQNQSSPTPTPQTKTDPFPSETPSFNQPTLTPTPGQSHSEDTGTINQKRYISPRLGISFLYLSKYLDQDIHVLEEDNKIYVYAEQGAFGSGNYSEGQYVEVLTKDRSDDLKIALEKNHLTNYSPNDCTASIKGTKTINHQVFTTGNIDVAKDPLEIDFSFEGLEDCPSPYTASNGISYFLYDPDFPTKYFFFSIGQYGLAADPETEIGWQDTFQVIN